MESSFEQTLQDGKLNRQLNSFIVAHLRDNNLNQASTCRIFCFTFFGLENWGMYEKAASAVASATMTPLNVEAPPNKLLELFAKGLAVEKDEILRGVTSSASYDLSTSLPATYGSIPAPRAAAVDFRQSLCLRRVLFLISGGRDSFFQIGSISCEVANVLAPLEEDTKGSSKNFPKHETRHLSEHKNIARCARFSADGRFVASGSADTSIKLFEVAKIKQMMLPDAKDGPVRPVVRTFYDHIQPINDLDFHPQNTVLISGAKDHTIKFFDFSKMTAKRAFRVIQVRYSSTGGMYVTASKDGAVRFWDGVTANCVRSIVGAHGTAEATSANFTKDQRFVLSCGKDSTVKLWEVGTGRLVKQYDGATHLQLRCQAVFNDTEEFVLSIDEPSNEVVIWDALTAEKVAKWPSNHIGAPRWLEHSPTEAAFVSCGTDRSIRFWKETQ
ncbi:Cleavage stimulation factor subunit 1 [Morella rubra]|uniref:Cleavage stimulation factor 50 kDa subunit n=1 Tax=Morella rubra TaxID=262757 RepID=A0A6A1VV60_9ROSI|nr:Cleavage stimulation factor subunit 1 [Morella rubra]